MDETASIRVPSVIGPSQGDVHQAWLGTLANISAQSRRGGPSLGLVTVTGFREVGGWQLILLGFISRV